MKKLLATLVILTMTVTIVGCGKKKSDDVADNSTAGAGNIETTSENEVDETAEVTLEQEQAGTEEEPTFAAETEAPTQKPTEAPTQKPTEAPTQKPTEAPSETPTYSRDASYTFSFVRNDGKTIECVVEYDSSKIAFDLVDNDIFVSAGRDIPFELYAKVTYMHPFDETAVEPWEATYGYPVIKTGCTSYENYKKYLIDKFKTYGDPAPTISELSKYTANGYTYYFLEGFYRGDTMGDPDIIYVQIGDNEFIEMYSVQIVDNMKDFVNTCFYIKEVTIK